MNSCHFTGWLPKDADLRFDAKANEAMTFEMIIKSNDGVEHRHPFRLDNASTIARCRQFLTRGRSLVVEAEAISEPVMKHGIHVADRRLYRVLAIEIPNRAKPEESNEAKEEAAAS